MARSATATTNVNSATTERTCSTRSSATATASAGISPSAGSTTANANSAATGRAGQKRSGTKGRKCWRPPLMPKFVLIRPQLPERSSGRRTAGTGIRVYVCRLGNSQKITATNLHQIPLKTDVCYRPNFTDQNQRS